jgi:hypothetical protein
MASNPKEPEAGGHPGDDLASRMLVLAPSPSGRCLLPLTLTIPEDVHFPDLRLRRTPDGHYSFALRPIQRICEASGIEPFHGSQIFIAAFIAALITHWYDFHLASGGDPDPVAELHKSEAEWAETQEAMRRGNVFH